MLKKVKRGSMGLTGFYKGLTRAQFSGAHLDLYCRFSVTKDLILIFT